MIHNFANWMRQSTIQLNSQDCLLESGSAQMSHTLGILRCSILLPVPSKPRTVALSFIPNLPRSKDIEVAAYLKCDRAS